MEYIPGSTEFATKYHPASDSYRDWTIIPDEEGEVFPLSGNGVVISEKMTFCNRDNWTCKDSIFIRFKVVPQRGLPKTTVFDSRAKIIDKYDGSEYLTNRSFPLRLKPAACVRDTECPMPTRDMCGGVGSCPECGEPGLPDCPEGMKCEDEKCVVDDEDKLVSESVLDGSSVLFFLGKNNKKFHGQILNHFIITSEIDHNDEIVEPGRKFNFAIEPEYIKTSGIEETVVVGDKIDFAQFTIEPDGNFFIVTRGQNDPFPPDKHETRGIVPVMQLRTKSIKDGDILDSITIRTTEKSVKFKEGIDKAYLYLDMDGDGKISSSDMKVYEVSEIEDGVFVFDNLQLSYDDGEEKQLVIALALNLKNCGVAQIEVVEAGLKVDGKSEVMGLPISSREFIYQFKEPGAPDYTPCDELDQNNDSVPDTAPKTKGCSVLVF